LLVCHGPSVGLADYERAREPGIETGLAGRVIVVAHDWATVEPVPVENCPDEAPIEIRLLRDDTCDEPTASTVGSDADADADAVAVRRGAIANFVFGAVTLSASFAVHRWWNWPAWVLALPVGYAAFIIVATAVSVWRARD
jgi:hypothetical protein